MHQIKVQQFEGPLDLLLSLIEEQKLDITQIALAEVTEQFLQYIKQLEDLDATSLADYLSIAAKLLVIKSKAILPSLEVEPEEEEFALDLTEKLLLYKQFKEVAKHLKQIDSRQRQSFTRDTVFAERINFFPDPTVDPTQLHENIVGILQSLQELNNLPQAKIREAISIQEKIDQLQLQLSGQIETKLSSLLGAAKNKPEVIVTFLALLELIKQRIFMVDQEALFTDITIRKYEKTPEEELADEESEDESDDEED